MCKAAQGIKSKHNNGLKVVVLLKRGNGERFKVQKFKV